MAFPSFGQEDIATNYILKYNDIAIREMYRSGIPASITLAQGIYESGYGMGESARLHNNHFGIKCKKEWGGAYFFKTDDDYNAEGHLIRSCFRAYKSAEDSFRDHTDFLLERERYAVLFTYSRMDYVAWAHGLKACGYATNKQYAYKLIELIDRYSLWQFDYAPNPDILANEALKSVPSIENSPTKGVSAKIVNSVESDIPNSVEKLVLEQLPSTPVGTNRVNSAIVLPANYRPKPIQ